MNQAWQMIQGFMAASRISIYGSAPLSAPPPQSDGHRPQDLVPQAQSLVSFGLAAPKGIYQENGRGLRLYWRQANLYYRHLDLLSYELAARLEELGGVSCPVPACFPFDLIDRHDFVGYTSLPAMAQACGLGVMGKNGLLMHPQHGPRLHLGGVITTLELPLHTQGAGPAVPCPDDCTICRQACPAQALDGSGKVDRPACSAKSSHSPLLRYFLQQAPQPLDLPQMETLAHLTAIDDHQMYTCMECVRACPML